MHAVGWIPHTVIVGAPLLLEDWMPFVLCVGFRRLVGVATVVVDMLVGLPLILRR